MNNNQFYIFSFYKFVKVRNKSIIKTKIESFLSDKIVRGTILLADEGINASISGSLKDLDIIVRYIEELINVNQLDIKKNQTNFLPFNRMKVRLKNEIVSLGLGAIDIDRFTGKFIEPSEWDSILKDKNAKILDVRNIFETKIGNFENSIDLFTKSFREFLEKFTKLQLNKNEKIAMYCTGGIRCEKASAFLSMKGYRNIVQLKGGIINYLQHKKGKDENSLWNGECFVFDDRVAINNELNKGNYYQCYGCRSPITEKDMLSTNYLKGAYCPFCYDKKSKEKIENSLVRQKQINTAQQNNLSNPFIKIGKYH